MLQSTGGGIASLAFGELLAGATAESSVSPLMPKPPHFSAKANASAAPVASPGAWRTVRSCGQIKSIAFLNLIMRISE